MSNYIQNGGGTGKGIMLIILAIIIISIALVWYNIFSYPSVDVNKTFNLTAPDCCSNVPKNVIIEALSRGMLVPCRPCNTPANLSICQEKAKEHLPVKYYDSKIQHLSGRLNVPIETCDGKFQYWDLADKNKL